MLLVARWRGVRALAPEVLAMPVASLGAFALAQLVLFQLYLPHRYTYPLMAFFAIAVAVLLRPLWQTAGRRGLALLACPAAVAALAMFAFPLAPAPPPDAVTWVLAALAAGAACAAALWRAPERVRTSAGAAATGALLLVVILVLPNSPPHGATHLWIRRHAVARGARWRPRRPPYGRYVHDLLREGEPASLRLPAACRQWRTDRPRSTTSPACRACRRGPVTAGSP